jgi:hypothetical protein
MTAETDQAVGVRAVRALRAGDEDAARGLVVPVLESLGLGRVESVTFTSDEYSLNSVSGRVRFDEGVDRFFKFHAEEEEGEHVHEYYRAHLLKDVGLPVEVPLALNSLPGEQIAVYEVREEPRMVDVCVELERRDGPAAAVLPAELVQARHELDAVIGRVAVESLRGPTTASADAAIHQLFAARLIDRDGSLGGSRFARFYADDPTWQRLSSKRWRVGAVEYESTLAEVVHDAASMLRPGVLARGPVVTAHGDDHQGNVWCRRDVAGKPFLTLFDPAFAGDDLPALLAFVKPTYHNALAHPFWLYHPDEATPVAAEEDDEWVHVLDPLQLSPLRRAILDSAVENVWVPLLSAMSARQLLPTDWRQTVRLALAMCPLLVTNLVDPRRSAAVRLLGLMQVAVAASEPSVGTDALTEALDRMEGAVTAATTGAAP